MKEINDEIKYRIADLYQNTRMSAGSIASALGICRDTVLKYKDLKIPVQRRVV